MTVKAGFTAWTQSLIEEDEEEPLNLTEVLLNMGGFYSNVTGQFACDVGGVYYVAITIKRPADTRLFVNVDKGEDHILTLSDSKNPGISVTNSRLLTCTPGEYLALNWGGLGTQWGGLGSVYGQPGVPQSTFTAILMQETGLWKSCIY